MSKEFKMRYRLECETGKFTEEDLKREESEGVDALVMFSVLYPEGEKPSLGYYSLDGRNNGEELDNVELYKIFLALGEKLAAEDGLEDFKKQVAVKTSDLFLKLIEKEDDESSH